MESLISSNWNRQPTGLTPSYSQAAVSISTSPSSWGSDAAQAVVQKSLTGDIETAVEVVTPAAATERAASGEGALTTASDADGGADKTTPSASVLVAPPASGTAGSANSGQANLQARELEDITAVARHYTRQLLAAGELVWGCGDDASKKWTAITTLSKIQEDLARKQAAKGLTRLKETQQEGVVSPGRELTQEVLHLAEFGLQALDHFSRHAALSSVGMEFSALPSMHSSQ